MKEKLRTSRSSIEAIERCWSAERAFIESAGAKFGPMAEALHPDIVLYQAESLPYGGEWRGHEGLEAWLHTMRKTWSSLELKDAHLVEGHDIVIVLATFEAQARLTGRKVRMPICEEIRLRDGLPVEWRVFYFDTGAILNALDPSVRDAQSVR